MTRVDQGYLVDKSAWARQRHPSVAAAIELVADRIVMIDVIMMELLYSARSADDYESMRTDLRALTHVPTGEPTWRLALRLQALLARGGRHRAASIPDLLIAATAIQHNLTVLHYDRDFEVIGETFPVFGQRPVVPFRSVP